MITIEQIRAARGLLGWNQEDLAKFSGFSKNSINSLELQKVKPRLSTLSKIRITFESFGIEFIDGPGVKLVGELLKVRLFEGVGALNNLWEDIIKENNQERLLNGVQEDKYASYNDGRVFSFFNRCIKKNIKGRILLKHGDTNFIDYSAQYRWTQKGKFSSNPYYVYGNKYAILLWEPVMRVLVVENPQIAKSYTDLFNSLWKESTSIPESYLNNLENFKDKHYS